MLRPCSAHGPSLLQASRAFSAATSAAAADAGNAVLCFGMGHQGALGLRDTRDQYEPEQIPDLPKNIAAIGAGHLCSFAATAEGQLWSWGRNEEQQLGRPLVDGEFGCSPVPRPVPALERHHIVAATGSGVASFALARDGSVFAFGRSKRGQLGLGPGVAAAEAPQQVQLPAAAAQVSAGWGHAAALLEDSSVWTWGWPAHGRLGHSFAAAAADEEEARLGERCCWEPRRVELLEGARVRQVECGFDHTAVLTEDGSLFTFGDNSLCQLGRAAQPGGEHLRPPCASAWLVNPETECGRRIKFRRVAAGLGHMLGVLADGSVAAWGWNSAGQLGLGQFVTEECVGRPTPIFGIPQNKHALLAAGRVHSLLLTEDVLARHKGAAAPLTMPLSWGSAANGRLGTGLFEDAYFPEMIPDLDGERLLAAAAGLDHSLVLAAAGP